MTEAIVQKLTFLKKKKRPTGEYDFRDIGGGKQQTLRNAP
jgi:hypothetical protein